MSSYSTLKSVFGKCKKIIQNYVRILINAGQIEKADKYIAEEIDTVSKHDIDTQLLKLSKLKKQQTLSDYIKSVNNALEIYPQSEDLWLELAIQYEKAEM